VPITRRRQPLELNEKTLYGRCATGFLDRAVANPINFEESCPMRIDKLISAALEGQKLMLKNTPIISTSPDIMGGTPVFAGTRVPIQTLLDYLKAGESIDDFLDGFPTVTREQVITLLEEAGKQLVGMVA